MPSSVSRQMRSLGFWPPVLAASLVLVACSRDPGETVASETTGAGGGGSEATSAGGATASAGGNTSGTTSGTGGSGGDVYVAGLEKDGESGIYAVRLVESAPIPKDTGLYTWTVQLVDANGSPVADAVMEAEPRMPAHDHGTFPPITEAIVEGTPGTYTLEAMDLFMPGIWEVSIRVLQGEVIEDQVFFYFDLEG